MVAAPVDSDLRDVLDLILRHGYSRIPVYQGELDDIVGVVYAKDVLRHLHAGKATVPIEKIMRPPYFVPETKRAADLLREMQKRSVHFAIVLDEYGSVAGLVTMEDLHISEPGGGPRDVLDGCFDRDGEAPCQVDGGLKCFGHPIGASGLRMAYEVYLQLLGRAGARQLPNVRLGLTHNLGGFPFRNVSAVAILGRA